MKKKIKDTRPGYNTAPEWDMPTVSEYKKRRELYLKQERFEKRLVGVLLVLVTLVAIVIVVELLIK